MSLLERIKTISFQKFIYGYLVALVFLLPLLFTNTLPISFVFFKVIPLFIFVILGVIYLVINSFKEGRFTYSTSLPVIALISIPVLYLLSAFVTKRLGTGIMGSGFDIDTVSFSLVLVLLTLIVASIVRTRERVFYLFASFGASFGLLAIFHILRMFGSNAMFNFLKLSAGNQIIDNTVGKWTELGVLAGIATLLTCISIEFVKVNRIWKTIFYVMLGASLLILSLVNFPVFIWGNFVFSFATLIGLFALVFFVYLLSSLYAGKTEANHKRTVPIASLVVFIVGICVTLAYNQINTHLYDPTHVVPRAPVNLSIPNWQETVSLTGTLFKEKHFLGVGPNNFTYYWLLHKPQEVNVTSSWNYDFSNAVGYIPTILITAGIPAFLAMMIFLISLFILGCKSLFNKDRDVFSNYIVISSFLVAFVFWIVLLTYAPGQVVIALAFIFTGAFMGMLFRDGFLKEKYISFEESKRKSFLSILALTFVIIFVVSWAFSFYSKVSASVYSNKAAIAYSGAQKIEDLGIAENYINKALQSDPTDAYIRGALQIRLGEAFTALADKNLTKDKAVNIIQQASNDLSQARTLLTDPNTGYDPKNYLNYVALAQGAQNFVSLNIQGAYDASLASYQKAQELNPYNPLIAYQIAELELANKDTTKAKDSLVKAIQLKPNYQDAYFLLAQTLIQEGDAATAIQSAQAGASLTPTNPYVYFQLGLLQYSNKAYGDAIQSFERTISLVGGQADVANVKYFLALAEYNNGDKAGALVLFQELQKQLPDNESIRKGLDNLNAGLSPTVGLPNQNSSLPVNTDQGTNATVTGAGITNEGTKTVKATTTKATTTAKTTKKN